MLFCFALHASPMLVPACVPTTTHSCIRVARALPAPPLPDDAMRNHVAVEATGLPRRRLVARSEGQAAAVVHAVGRRAARPAPDAAGRADERIAHPLFVLAVDAVHLRLEPVGVDIPERVLADQREALAPATAGGELRRTARRTP